jgi:hypothetical protein
VGQTVKNDVELPALVLDTTRIHDRDKFLHPASGKAFPNYFTGSGVHIYCVTIERMARRWYALRLSGARRMYCLLRAPNESIRLVCAEAEPEQPRAIPDGGNFGENPHCE